MDPNSFEAAAVCALWNSGDRGDWYMFRAERGPILIRKSNWDAVCVILQPDGTVEPDPQSLPLLKPFPP